jgi:hypothetical protein
MTTFYDFMAGLETMPPVPHQPHCPPGSFWDGVQCMPIVPPEILQPAHLAGAETFPPMPQHQPACPAGSFWDGHFCVPIVPPELLQPPLHLTGADAGPVIVMSPPSSGSPVLKVAALVGLGVLGYFAYTQFANKRATVRGLRRGFARTFR